MSNPDTTPNPAEVDPREALPNAGDATDAEAALIAAGTDVGEDGAPLDAIAAAQAQAQAQADAAAAEAKAAADAAAQATAAAATEAARALPVPVAPVTAAWAIPAKPEPPKDFEAARATLKQQYDDAADGMDEDAYFTAREALAREEGAYLGKVSAWEMLSESAQANAKAAADADFNAVALAWERQNAAFVANPLRQQAMQQAVDLIDKAHGYTLAPAEIFAQAEKIVFEAYNYTPATPTGTPAKTAAQAEAEALAGRRPSTANVPATLASAPQAASLDPNNANFTALDNLDISAHEDVLARMTPAQVEAYLADAPGAKTTGQE